PAPTQASVVSQVLANPFCGDSPTPGNCNVQFPVDVALDEFGHLNERLGVLPFAQIQHQIDELQRPIAILLQLTGPAGTTNHTCLIKGCEMVGLAPHITLLDPSPVNGTESHMSYDDLRSGVVLGGPWQESFTLR